MEALFVLKNYETVFKDYLCFELTLKICHLKN